MKRNKSTISKASSYSEMGAYWDEHNLDECWEKTQDADFEFIAEPQITYFAIEKNLSEKIRSLASKQGVSPDTLVNMWVQEKVLSC
jgi:hypothetical protein